MSSNPTKAGHKLLFQSSAATASMQLHQSRWRTAKEQHI